MEPSLQLWLLAGGGFGVAMATSFIATRLVLAQLRHRNLLDIPNERSSHTIPTPRGGGWGVVIGAVATSAAALALTGGSWAIGVGLAVLTGVILSWRDDLGGLSVRVRLCAQYLAAAAALAGLVLVRPAFPDESPFNGPIVDAPGIIGLLVGVPVLLTGYVWFVNLYNFMDGIDGISAVETICVLAGIACVATLGGTPVPVLIVYPLIVAGAATGFLVWNWHPAKVFLGDVGSIPLGIAVGFFLLAFAAHGYVASAIILPLYYIADSSLTLLRRLLRGDKVWQAHRTHWYQRAAMAIGHRKTVLVVLAGNLGLGLLALIALAYPISALGLAVVWTALMLTMLSRLAKGVQPLSTA